MGSHVLLLLLLLLTDPAFQRWFVLHGNRRNQAGRGGKTPFRCSTKAGMHEVYVHRGSVCAEKHRLCKTLPKLRLIYRLKGTKENKTPPKIILQQMRNTDYLEVWIHWVWVPVSAVQECFNSPNHPHLHIMKTNYFVTAAVINSLSGILNHCNDI